MKLKMYLSKRNELRESKKNLFSEKVHNFYVKNKFYINLKKLRMVEFIIFF